MGEQLPFLVWHLPSERILAMDSARIGFSATMRTVVIFAGVLLALQRKLFGDWMGAWDLKFEWRGLGGRAGIRNCWLHRARSNPSL